MGASATSPPSTCQHKACGVVPARPFSSFPFPPLENNMLSTCGQQFSWPFAMQTYSCSASAWMKTHPSPRHSRPRPKHRAYLHAAGYLIRCSFATELMPAAPMQAVGAAFTFSFRQPATRPLPRAWKTMNEWALTCQLSAAHRLISW